MKTLTLSDYIGKKLKNADFKCQYNRELLINGIAKMIVALRYSANLTQQQLAKKTGTTQSVIARLESGTDERIPSIDLLARIASASHATLNISFISQ